jgi:hypothetical protein
MNETGIAYYITISGGGEQQFSRMDGHFR